MENYKSKKYTKSEVIQEETDKEGQEDVIEEPKIVEQPKVKKEIEEIIYEHKHITVNLKKNKMTKRVAKNFFLRDYSDWELIDEISTTNGVTFHLRKQVKN